MSKSDKWVFTINNPTKEDDPALWDKKFIKYCVYQIEKGKQGTYHCQGYVIFTTRWSFDRVKKLMKDKAHIETRKGTHTQAKEYCKKQDTRVGGPWELGNDEGIPDKAGERSDLLELQADIKAGANLLDCYENHFKSTMQYPRGVKEYINLLSQPRTEKTFCILIIGKTNIGKTHWVMNNCELEKTYWKRYTMGKWWDGYIPEIHENVVIDEFHKGWELGWAEMLGLCDKYPFKVQQKQGYVEFKAKNIVVTSNQDYTEWFPKMAKHLEALKRRFEVIKYVVTREDCAAIPSIEEMKQTINEDTGQRTEVAGNTNAATEMIYDSRSGKLYKEVE